ncbi:MAG: insulinase family protein [Muribaculaceae bacterium]|nr:insulinase family protein [Muribaculaceae bacterium]
MTLTNGCGLSVLSRGDQEVNCLTISFPRGATDLSTDSIYKIVQSTIIEGTKNYSPADISNTLDFNGAWLKVDIGTHFTDVKLYSLNSTFANLLPLISDIINNPLFDDEIVKHTIEREIAGTEINFKKVAVMADLNMREAISGPGSKLRNCDTIPDTLRRLKVEDVKEGYKSIFCASAPMLSISGLITDSMVKSLDEGLQLNAFGLPLLAPDNYIKQEPQFGRRYIEMPDTKQAAVAIGIPTIDRNHPDYCKLRIAIMALGGYFGSRLMKTIREEMGLTYGISAVLAGQPEGSYISIKCQTTQANVDRVIEEINNQINLMITNPLSPEELANLKATAMSSLVAVLDSPISILDYIDNLKRLNAPIDYFNKQQQAIEQITADEISRLISLYLKDQPTVEVIAGA